MTTNQENTWLASTNEGGSSYTVIDANNSVPDTVNDNTVSQSCTRNIEIASETSSRAETEPTNEQEMLRRRRLQKFSAQNTTE